MMGMLIFCLQLLGIRADIVMSGSMEPALKTGSLVFTNTHEKEPETGEIITFQVGNSRVTHRLIRIEKGCYVTKGDSNDWEDSSLVYRDQMIGTVLFSIPYLGYAAAFLKTKEVWIVTGMFAICSFIYHQTKDRKYKRQQKKEQKGERI